MGSMSGSVITNVLTTGVMSIPAMKRVGFSPTYAGGVEACASTGGVLMPPIMGATAFVMASFIEVPYSDIVLAAAIPSILYYFGLFVQIDAYAARRGIQGLPRRELPSIREVLKEGWYFVAVFALLVFMLLYLRREAQAPFYATLLLIAINQFSTKHRWDWAKLRGFVEAVGIMLAELAALLAGVGLIIGALTLSGKVGSIAYELVALAGDNVIVLLAMGALTSFILGMGMTVTAAYIFLAVTLAPALTTAGLDRMAVHLFMLYWGMISFITPPVSLGAFAAASIAKSDPMKTGFAAMRLGSIIYFLPFFFVLNPALIGHGSFAEVVLVVATAGLGIVLLAGGLQGYLLGFGAIAGGRLRSIVARVLLAVAGVVFALPGNEELGISHLALLVAGVCFAVPALALCWAHRRPEGSPA
jgi:TRAP transporter 4TM/12TM fusion protein